MCSVASFKNWHKAGETHQAFQGQGDFIKARFEAPRVIRFRHQYNFWKPKWFLPRTESFQQRVGGRIALVTEVKLWAHPVVTYNVHLESRGDKQLKLLQLSETLDDARQYPRSQPVVLAGDLNLDLSRSSAVAFGPAVISHSAIALPSPHTTTARGIFFVTDGQSIVPILPGRFSRNQAASLAT